MKDELPINDAGLWEELVPRPLGGGAAPAVVTAKSPALFLDRDGVLNEEVGYLKDPKDWAPIGGSAEVVAEMNRRGIPVVVVTNQGGVGRRELDWSDFARVQCRLLEHFAACGGAPDMVLACPFHEDAEPPYRHAAHPDRKPRPGMLLRAARRLGLDLSRSWIVGDSARDMMAGQAAGLAGGVMVATGHGVQERSKLDGWNSLGFRFSHSDSLAAARRRLLAALTEDATEA